jgi:hypothetical protein
MLQTVLLNLLPKFTHLIDALKPRKLILELFAGFRCIYSIFYFQQSIVVSTYYSAASPESAEKRSSFPLNTTFPPNSFKKLKIPTQFFFFSSLFLLFFFYFNKFSYHATSVWHFLALSHLAIYQSLHIINMQSYTFIYA